MKTFALIIHVATYLLASVSFAGTSAPTVVKGYALGEEGGVLFKAKGGSFERLKDVRACDTYPKCPEVFRKSWREKCVERTTTVELSYEKKLVESVDERWAGKCNAYGDAPQVKSLVDGSEKPTWIYDNGNGTALASWAYDGGYMWIFGYCKSMWDSSPIKHFKDCNVMQLYFKTGDAKTGVKDKLKVNNFDW